MRQLTRWIPVAFLVIALLVIGALSLFSGSEASESPSTNKAAQIQPVEGTSLSRVRLTSRAAERLGIKTTRVRAASGAAAGDATNTTTGTTATTGTQTKATTAKTVVPYASVIYEADGRTWVYTNPEPLVFIRARIEVETVNGDLAVLSVGPPVGTAVASVGVPELFGAEFGVGE